MVKYQKNPKKFINVSLLRTAGKAKNKSTLICDMYRKRMDMSCAYYFNLDKREENNHSRFEALFVTFPKPQIIVNTISLLSTKSPSYFWL